MKEDAVYQSFLTEVKKFKLSERDIEVAMHFFYQGIRIAVKEPRTHSALTHKPINL